MTVTLIIVPAIAVAMMAAMIVSIGDIYDKVGRQRRDSFERRGRHR
jgi:hypothetical protein